MYASIFTEQTGHSVRVWVTLSLGWIIVQVERHFGSVRSVSGKLRSVSTSGQLELGNGSVRVYPFNKWVNFV